MADYDFTVDGDFSVDHMIYVALMEDRSPNLREVWTEARGFEQWRVPGAAGVVIEVMRADGLSVAPHVLSDTSQDRSGIPESVFLLMERAPAGQDKGDRTWRMVKAFTSGEIPAGTTPSATDTWNQFHVSLDVKPKYGRVIVDYHQGWQAAIREDGEARAQLLDAISSQPALLSIRDPREDVWYAAREQAQANSLDLDVIWFSPFQDLDHGALRGPVDWDEARRRTIEYLREDPTLWRDGDWQQTLVIQLRNEGALILAPEQEDTLLHREGTQPDDFARQGLAGVLGSGVLMAASLASALKQPREQRVDALVRSTQVGLQRVAALHLCGFSKPSPHDADAPSTPLSDAIKPENGDSIVPAPYPREPEPEIDFLCKLIAAQESDFNRRLALRLGDLCVTQPDQARKLLDLTARIEAQLDGEGVLSFGIFGGPGSGKSFMARQLANAAGSEKFKICEFNVSQFSSPAFFISTLNEVRTASLGGKIPFVIWDEFDCRFDNQGYYWLSRFLMPMEDAAYIDGPSRLELGTCVFAFSGGTFADVDAFNAWIEGDGVDDGNSARILKGPDFRSRLDRVIAVPSVETEEDNLTNGRRTRAVLLRTPKYLGKWKSNLRFLDRDVLAFLLHMELANGARSLQRIIGASSLAKAHTFRRSNLPDVDVLQVHLKGVGRRTSDTVDSVLRRLPPEFGAWVAEKQPLCLEWAEG